MIPMFGSRLHCPVTITLLIALAMSSIPTSPASGETRLHPASVAQIKTGFRCGVGNPSFDALDKSTDVCGPFGVSDDPDARDAIATSPGLVVRTAIHVIKGPSGTMKVNPDQLIARINANLDPHGIQLELVAGLTHLSFESSVYAPYIDSGMAADLMNIRELYALEPDRNLNIYISRKDPFSPVDGWGQFPWEPYALDTQGGVWINYESLKGEPNLLTHEVGHVLGLLHTHQGVAGIDCYHRCFETVDRTDADRTGDLCSDTPAMPNQSGYCGSPQGTNCRGETWDVGGSITNYMAYIDDSCRTEFTPQQSRRMRSWLSSRLSAWLEPFGDPDKSVAVTSNLTQPGAQFVTCPQGDQHQFTVTLDFADDTPATIPADALSLTIPANGVTPFATNLTATGDATPSNGFKTSFTTGALGGCGTTWAEPHLNGSFLGSAYLRTVSPDMTGDGLVNIADLGEFGIANGTVPGDPGWTPCADLTGNGAVDAGDLGVLISHYGHAAQSAKQLMPATTAEVIVRQRQTTSGDIANEVIVRHDGAAELLVLRWDPAGSVGQAVWSALEGAGVGPSVMAHDPRTGRMVLAVPLAGPSSPDHELTVGTITTAGGDIDWLGATVFSPGGVQVAVENIRVEKPAPDGGGVPGAYARIESVYPNPFNPSVNVKFAMAAAGPARLAVYDLGGKLIRVLHDASLGAGGHQVTWNGMDDLGVRAASGMYLIRLEAGREIHRVKVMMVQ